MGEVYGIIVLRSSVAIPRSISRMRDMDRDQALRWRLRVRDVFEHYINREGYIAVEFFNLDERLGLYIIYAN
jgi:predicted GNAT superfamily acetyltransferase